MAIRIRKIENSRQSLSQVSNQTKQKREVGRRVRKWIVIFFPVFICILVYFLFFVKPLGYVVINADSVTIRSSVDGYIDRILQNDGGSVEKGELICEIVIPQDLDRMQAIKKEYHERLLQKKEAQIEIQNLNNEINRVKQKIQRQTIELTLRHTLTQDALERGKNATTKAKKIFLARKDNLEKAARLWNLDAIAKGDYLAAERVFADAETAYKNALIFEKSLKAEKEAAAKTLDLAAKDAKEELERKQSVLRERQEYQAEIEKDINRLDQLKTAGEHRVAIKAPMSGHLLNNDRKQGEYIAQGETLMRVYDPKTLEIDAYVKEEYRPRVTVGTEVTVELKNKLFKAKIQRIKPELVNPPPQLKNRKLVSTEAYYLVLILDSSNAPDTLQPGQVGKVIFD